MGSRCEMGLLNYRVAVRVKREDTVKYLVYC